MNNETKDVLGIDQEGLTPYSRAYKKAMEKEPVPKFEQETYLRLMGEQEPVALQRKVDVAKTGLEERTKLQDSPEYKQAVIGEFAPSQENATDLAKLFTLVTAMTFMGGGSGRYSGTAALNSMASAMEGYKKGRKDVFEQELKNYDKYMKSTIENNKRLGDLLTKKLEAMKDGDQIKTMQIDAELKALTSNQGALAGIEKMNSEQAVKTRDKIFELNQQWLKDEQARKQRIQDRAAKTQVFQGSDGKMYAFDPYTQQVTQIETPEGVKLTKPGAGGRGSALNDRYAFNINESFSQAATDLLNVSQMPGNTVLGAFAGMTGQTGDTLTKSLTNVLARKVTPEDQRLMQQIVAGLDQNMARALGGGYATSTSKGLIQAYKEQVAQMGDSPLAQAMFLSRMKQELGILARAFKNHPGANEGYISDMNEYMSSLDKAIPFAVSDVISANRGKKITVTDKFANLAQTPSVVPLPSADGSVTEKPTVAPPLASEKQKAQSGEQIFTDAAGNKAVKRNGQWVEVE